MVDYIDSGNWKRRIEAEASYTTGYVTLKLYNDKHNYGDALEIPLEEFAQFIVNAEFALLEAKEKEKKDETK